MHSVTGRVAAGCCMLLRRAVLALGMAASPAWALETVTLQLKWTHAFQFAGYYAAQEKGYYREAGLAVRLQEAGPGVDPVQVVVSGQAQYGVGTSSLLLARHAGQPVVVLAVVFQHSPLVLLARTPAGAQGTQGIHDLVGQRVMIEPLSDELIAYLKQEGIAAERLVRLPHSFNPRDLIEGRVDAITAYVTNEPYYLDRAGLVYQTYTPRTGGIDFYGDNLFTTEAEIRDHPERVRAFRQASLRGWKYAMEHPEELAELIHRRYSRQHPREFYLFEAQRMVALLRTDLVELGYMYAGRWQHIASTYADLGLLPRDPSLTGFLYAPDPHPDFTSLYITLGLLLAVSGVALYVYRLNQRLAGALAESRLAEGQIRHLSLHDPLTGLPNRELMFDRLTQALAATRREGGHVAVMFVDLDHFKSVNDQFGHAVGDRLLQQAARRLRAGVRESDTVARIGGDEFVVLLPRVAQAQEALAVGRALCEALSRPFEVAQPPVTRGASIGIALSPMHGTDDMTLLRHADQAMYAAKHGGRSRVQLFEPAG